MSRFSLRAPEQNEKNPGGDEPAKPANICLCYIIVYIHIYIYIPNPKQPVFLNGCLVKQPFSETSN